MAARLPAETLDDVLELMSTEHQLLSESVDRITSAIASQDLPVIRRELLHLQSSEQIHFRHEEEVMERCNFPGLVSHKDQHGAMVKTLSSIIRLVFVEKLRNISGDLGKYLERSLRHTMEHDNDFRDFLLKLRKDAG
ncbi:MAG: hemerythrin family protein [Proteobacteria bacterium]|nr:hemerythrin family protein [Pseudomonadota bacterium]